MLVSQAKSLGALRVVAAFLAVAPFGLAQTVPAFNWIQEVDGSGADTLAGMGTDAQGNVYLVGSTSSSKFPVKAAEQGQLAGASNCYVTKLDSAGNMVYSTYFGGNHTDTATAMAVDAAGDVYVTGTTNSTNFPTTKGAYLAPVGALGLPVAPLNGSFLFKLNPDGSVGYSTYFTAFGQGAGLQGVIPQAIAVDDYGLATIAGKSYGGLPITQGAYHSFCCDSLLPTGGISLHLPNYSTAFLTRFNSAGSGLVFSTYLDSGHPADLTAALALSPDGSAYVSDPFGVYHFDARGSTVLASNAELATNGTHTLALAADGTLYVAATIGLVRVDAPLQNILAVTNFHGGSSGIIKSLLVDETGNIYLGGSTGNGSSVGSTGAGLRTMTPMFIGFGAGFLSEVSGDLSTLLFSSYYGADKSFSVQSVAAGLNGSVLIGGVDLQNQVSGNVWVNSLALTAPPALRIDSIQNAASLIDSPISAGETIVVTGAGFGTDARLLMGGAAIPTISISPGTIVATVPQALSGNYAVVEVVSGGASSNQVVIQTAKTSPGLYAADGTGYGPAYILNQDGTINSPSHPAAPGERITVFATGVGLLSFDHGYAVTAFPPDMSIAGAYCNGVEAFLGPVAGLPGNVFQLTVYVPNPSKFKLPPLSPVHLELNGAISQDGLTISIAQ